MANAGLGAQSGQPNAPYYLANSPQQLTDAFDQIIGGVVSCDLMISGNVDPSMAQNGTVTLRDDTYVRHRSSCPAPPARRSSHPATRSSMPRSVIL